MKNLVLYSMFLWVLAACSNTHVDPVFDTTGYRYFPTDSNLWREFEVTEITIDKASNVYDTSIYFMKEVWGGIYTEASNDTMQILKRYIKPLNGSGWQFYQKWRAAIQSNAALQVEENIKYIKLRFPLALGNTWNGDAFNRLDTIQEFEYEITELNEAYTINGINFDSVLTVTQKSKTSFIDKVFFTEKFAIGIGLIEKIQIDIYSHEEDYDPTIAIENRVTKGTLYTQKLIDYGKN